MPQSRVEDSTSVFDILCASRVAWFPALDYLPRLSPKKKIRCSDGAGRGRYYPGYRDGFALECRAIRKVREEIGLKNVAVMIPLRRTLGEADKTLQAMADNRLRRGEDGPLVYVMCEIPSNVILAEQFAERFDGLPIGSNDVPRLTPGVGRDSEQLASLFDQQSEAATRLIAKVIPAAHKFKRKVGLCSQAPSDHPQFARFLVHAGSDSISVSPDRFLRVKRRVAAAESAPVAGVAAVMEAAS
jgi:pyruvate,water dikinase